MKIIHVTGARPNFPKMAPVERALREGGHEQFLIHTGQHFDRNLSGIFFEQLGIPEPDVNLGIGSGTHATQTASIMTALEPLLLEQAPRAVLVYGDVNSTLAAAIVAKKVHIPVVHVEAGLRSGDRTMPEELNRLVVDAISDQLFTTAEEASYNLVREGARSDSIHFVGNPMIDTLMRHRDELADTNPASDAGIDGEYALVTMHRPANVDQPEDAKELAEMLGEVSKEIPILFPIHPRAAGRLPLGKFANIHTVDPLGYLDFLAAMKNARLVITDSGGVQEETTVLGVPCLTVRPNTERPVTITHGTNKLVTRAAASAEARNILSEGREHFPVPPLWDGHAGPRIAKLIEYRFGA